jgi:ribosomal-protein-alanine N-acetyltransferase
MRELHTLRLVLEPVTLKNAKTMWRLMQASDLRAYQDIPRYSVAEFERRVIARPERFDGNGLGRFEWMIVPRGAAEPAGWISLRVGESSKGTAEIAYTLLLEHRGKRYTAEAIRAVVGYGFAVSPLRRIEACCVPANVPSRRALESAGFRMVRLQRNGAVVSSRTVDIVLFEMRRRDWMAAQASSANAIDIPESANR